MSAAAVLATRGGFPVNLKYVFEGEEESTSAHLDAWLDANRDLLAGRRRDHQRYRLLHRQRAGDHVGLRGHHVRPDRRRRDRRSTSIPAVSAASSRTRRTPWPRSSRRSRVPMAGSGSRGSTTTSSPLVGRGPGGDRRAAVRRGGVPEPLGVCRRSSARSAITTLERSGARPTLDVNGIWGGFQGEGSKTIIPAHAHAKVSCRLVADQDPERIFEAFRDFVAEIAPPGVTVTTSLLGAGRASLTPIDHPATQAAARAIEKTFGSAPVYIREGGSIPVCASFTSTLGLPVVLFGFTQPECNAHAPNEWMDLDNYEGGIRAIARLWDELADLPHWTRSRTPLPDVCPAVSDWAVRMRWPRRIAGATLAADCFPREGPIHVTAKAPDTRASAPAWRLDTDNGSLTPRSALDVLVDLNDKVTTGQRRASTSPSRSGSPRSTRRSGPACGPGSCCSSAAPRAPARRRWPSRWRATSPRAARPTSSTSASSTTSSTSSTGSSRWSRRSPTCPTRRARSRSRTSARRSSGPGWPRARRTPRWRTTRACGHRWTGSPATARTSS